MKAVLTLCAAATAAAYQQSASMLPARRVRAHAPVMELMQLQEEVQVLRAELIRKDAIIKGLLGTLEQTAITTDEFGVVKSSTPLQECSECGLGALRSLTPCACLTTLGICERRICAMQQQEREVVVAREWEREQSQTPPKRQRRPESQEVLRRNLSGGGGSASREPAAPRGHDDDPIDVDESDEGEAQSCTLGAGLTPSRVPQLSVQSEGPAQPISCTTDEPVAQESIAQEPAPQETVPQEPVPQVAQEPIAREPVPHDDAVQTRVRQRRARRGPRLAGGDDDRLAAEFRNGGSGHPEVA